LSLNGCRPNPRRTCAMWVQQCLAPRNPDWHNSEDIDPAPRIIPWSPVTVLLLTRISVSTDLAVLGPDLAPVAGQQGISLSQNKSRNMNEFLMMKQQIGPQLFCRSLAECLFTNHMKATFPFSLVSQLEPYMLIRTIMAQWVNAHMHKGPYWTRDLQSDATISGPTGTSKGPEPRFCLPPHH